LIFHSKNWQKGITFKHFLSGSYTHSFFMMPTDSTELLKIILDLRCGWIM